MLTLTRTDSTNNDFITLVRLLDLDLQIRDGEDHAFYAQFNKIDAIKNVIVAYWEDQAVGCGAVKYHTGGTGEIKRIYVHPEYRGKGIATAVLGELELWARELGWEDVILETGKAQPEAINLYQKNGYTLIPNYGPYEKVENSVCMKKTVSRPELTHPGLDTRQAYNLWANQYDTNKNKTRDLEEQALRSTLAHRSFDHCLEIGCGTGKNTGWLLEKARQVTAVDLSEKMLDRAKAKTTSERVQFIQADITTPWSFCQQPYDLVAFSLVLEHIEDLNPVFQEAARALAPGGLLYLGELHPFKQYSGTKARFDTAQGRHVVSCFNHHISDFLLAAQDQGLALVDLNEHFDNGDRRSKPRILTILFRKK